MKKMLLIFSIFILIGNVYASEYSNVNVNGVDFEIPSQYSGGDIEATKYVYEDLRTFALSCVDDYIINSCGADASICDYSREITISDRPCKLFTMYNKYIQANVSRLYFPVDQSVYCISFRSDNITPEISHIVESAPDHNMSSDAFYGLMDEAYAKYKEKQFLDALNDDDYMYASQLNSIDDSNDNLVKWFLLTR